MPKHSTEKRLTQARRPDPEGEIWHAASAMIEEFGSEAAGIALKRMGADLRDGDDDGMIRWNRIRRAIRELMRRERQEDERLN